MSNQAHQALTEVSDDIRTHLAAAAHRFNSDMAERLDRLCGVPDTLLEAMRYSLFAGGKRLRPFLVFSSCELCGGDRATALAPALAVECVHTFSLIHDDLPAIDNDDMRRGRPSCHKQFGEAIAILAGDALLTFAFEILSNDIDDPWMLKSMILELSAASGAGGLIGGEVADIEGESQPASLETVASVHLSKTARLIEAACVLGGLAARASNTQLAALREYGRRLGLAFQGQDDLLDATGQSETMGKPTRRDQGAGKQTYVRAVGEDEARSLVKAEAHRAVTSLKPFGDAAGALADLAMYMIERDA